MRRLSILLRFYFTICERPGIAFGICPFNPIKVLFYGKDPGRQDEGNASFNPIKVLFYGEVLKRLITLDFFQSY